VLNKDQALAAMDAQIIRVEAERTRRLERRVGRFRVLYPALRQVPLEEISHLVEEGRRYAGRRWTTYLSIGLFLAIFAWFVLLAPWLRHGERFAAGYTTWFFATTGAVSLVIHLHVRAYLNRTVSLLYPKSQD